VADGTFGLSRLTEVTRRSDEVRRGVADLQRGEPSGVDVTQQSTPLEGVVDELPLGSHPGKGTPRQASPQAATAMPRRPTRRSD
jgi:hypothetical protein